MAGEFRHYEGPGSGMLEVGPVVALVSDGDLAAFLAALEEIEQKRENQLKAGEPKVCTPSRGRLANTSWQEINCPTWRDTYSFTFKNVTWKASREDAAAAATSAKQYLIERGLWPAPAGARS